MTILCPLFGYVSDRINKRIACLAFANLLLTISQSSMAAMDDCAKCPYIIMPMTLFELSMGFYVTNVWAALK